jgi:hypothetical protein
MRQHIEWMYEITMYLPCLLTNSTILVSIRFQEQRCQVGAFQEITRIFGILIKIVPLHECLWHVDHGGQTTSQRGSRAGQPNLELVQAETWQLHSHVSSQEYHMPESQWKPGGVADRPHGWPPGRLSPPNRLNYVGGSSPIPLDKDPHGRIHTHTTLFL